MTNSAADANTVKWPSAKSFLLIWIATALVTWVLTCLLARAFMYPTLEAGLVPYQVLFALALLPILGVTLVVLIILSTLFWHRWPESPGTGKKLVLFGTPLLTWLSLLLLTWLAGGADAFVPRL